MLTSRVLRFLLAWILSLGLVACSDAAGPIGATGDVVFAVGGEGSSIFVIDPAAGRVLARPGPLPWVKRWPVFSTDSSVLFFVATDQHGSAIYALDIRGLTLRRWLDLDSPAEHHTQDGLWLWGGALATVSGVPVIYIGRAYNTNTAQAVPPDASSIAVVDTVTRRVVGTIAPLYVKEGGLATLPPGPAASSGALLAIGSRLSDQAPSLDWLFVIDPATRTVIDSASVTPPNPGRGGTLSGVLASPDGRHVYLRSIGGTLYGYDLLTRQVIGTAKLTGGGANLAISPDGTRLYAVDGGMPVLFVPWSDSIQVFDAASLAVLPSISLAGQAATDSVIPQVHNVAVSRDGKWLYLAAGDTHSGGQPPLRLLVMDRETGAITRVIPLGDTGRVTLVVGR